MMTEEVNITGDTNEQYQCKPRDNGKTTVVKLFEEVLDTPKTSLTRGFLALAEEAKHVCVRSEQRILVEEILPQVIGMSRPVDDEIVDHRMTTVVKSSTDFLEVPQTSLTRGFWGWPRRPCMFAFGMNTVF